MKRRSMWVLLALLCLAMTLPAMAEGAAPGVPAEEGRYVYDQSGLLSQDEEWEAQIAALRGQLAIDIVIVTADDAEGLTSRDYADDFYDYNNFGYDQPRGDGVLFLIDMDNREAYISTCGKAIYYFTDERIDMALDEIVAELGDADYDGACEDFLRLTEEFMTHAADAPLSYGYRLKRVLADSWLPILAVSVVAAGITVLLMVHSSQGRKASASVYLNSQTGFKLKAKEDQYINEFTTSRKIPKNEGSSGRSGGGGSSTHSSSSGTSHGGGGRSF